jgi:hypothetical protein
MVVFSAVEERDLRLRKSDACRERLGRRRTAVICMRRVVSGYGSLPRLPVDRSRRRKRYCRGIEAAKVNGWRVLRGRGCGRAAEVMAAGV